MATNTELADDFVSLDPKAARAIKPIRNSPEVQAAIDKREEMELRLKSLMQEIIEAEQSQREPRSASVVDAERLLAGEPLADRLPTTRLQDLHREREAVKTAIELQGQRITETMLHLVRENLEHVEPVVRKYVAATMKAIAEVQRAIEAEAKLFAYLRRMGYRDGVPGYWSILPAEQQILQAAASTLQSRRAGFPELNQ